MFYDDSNLSMNITKMLLMLFQAMTTLFRPLDLIVNRIGSYENTRNISMNELFFLLAHAVKKHCYFYKTFYISKTEKYTALLELTAHLSKLQ